MQVEKTPIELAGDVVGGLAPLAARLDVTVQVVSNWRTRGVPPDKCLAVERATDGKVTRRELRPDDWQLYWPELADKAAA
jgi:DNA-binding transcriptional regulator YdaS (Cro superfamily)